MKHSFHHDEINPVVANLPSSRSTVPNGFNTDFLKKCLHIVKYDFYEL